MGWNSHADFELHEEIDQAVDAGLLEEGTPAHGIALKAADDGLECLSSKQRYVFDNHVLPALAEVRAENANNERMNMSVID